MSWLATLWTQFFRDERVIEVPELLRANRTLGLFASLVFYVCLSQPERSTPLFTALVGLTLLTHLGGEIVVAFVPQALTHVLSAQGLTLAVASLGLVAMSTSLSLSATELSNVRYVPGIALMLLIQASLELHLFGPGWAQRLPLRRVGLVLGLAGELIMAGALLQRLW
jgi:hypothetical protein